MLERELRALGLPFRFVLDVEVPDVHLVTYNVDLPAVTELPGVLGRWNVLGQLYITRLTRRERYERLGACAITLALRLAHETFRVLPSVAEVETFGMRPDALPGAERPAAILSLRITRGALARADLGRADLCTLFVELGGRYGALPDASYIALEALGT